MTFYSILLLLIITVTFLHLLKCKTAKLLDDEPEDEPKKMRLTAKNAPNKVLEDFLEDVSDNSEEKAREKMLDK